MPAATSNTIMFHSHCDLGLPKGVAHPIPSENHTIEVLTENLSSLIIDLILRVNHDDILGPTLIKDPTDSFRVTAVDEYQFGHALLQLHKHLPNFVFVDAAKSANVIPAVILEL